jgi:amidohydrolase
VKLFFQPAEETIGGAQRMIEEGCMENPPVDYVCGLHVAPSLKTGEIEVKHGQMYAASDELVIRLHGKSSHGAYPDQGIDSIVMAASLILTLQSFVSRSISPLDQAVLSIGSIHGGTAHNILAESVELKGALRTTSPSTRKRAKEIIARQVKHVAAAFGGRAELEIKPGYDALLNTDALVDLLIDIAQPILGKEQIRQKTTPGMGVEDFSFFLNQAAGVFFHLGCGGNDSPPLHSPKFAIDEDCLSIGVRLEIELIQALLNQ